MKTRKDLKLRKIGSRYMLVEVNRNYVNMTDVFTLNITAACLWKRMGEGEFTVQELAEWMCEWFDVDIDTAWADINRTLNEWMIYGLVVE